MLSSLRRLAAALSLMLIARLTPVAPGSFELAMALSVASAAGCSCLVSVEGFPLQAERTDARTQRRNDAKMAGRGALRVDR
jgi:hypothetical protein